MTENEQEARGSLSLEDVAQAVLELNAEPALEGFVARFLDRVRGWAAPSAVVAAVRDTTASSGWRLLPALCVGSGPLDADRLVRQLVEELPEGLVRPTLDLPGNAVPGVRPRANCLVPWSCEGESGVLLLRGVASPSPPNLAEAIALLSVPVWPRLLGGPAARVEAGVAELRRLAEQLREEADRQLERLQAARPAEAAPPPAEEPAASRLAEQELHAARADSERLSALVASLRSERDAAEGRLEEERRLAGEARSAARAAEETLAEARRAGGDAEEALAEARKALADAEEALAEARRTGAEAQDATAQLRLEREELRQQVLTLEKAVGEAESERDAARAAGGGPLEQDARETGESLSRLLTGARRAPFLPPSLRVAVREIEPAAGAPGAGSDRSLRLALLDRDIEGIEPLVAQLESAGADVKVAGHPEEIALLLKTPEGRELDAVVCDILAFRPDQNVAGLFRSWEKDRPGLALYLNAARDTAPETERAQRVPLSLTRGRLQRPLQASEVIEMLAPLRRRSS